MKGACSSQAKHHRLLLGLVLLSASLAGCGGSSGGGSTPDNPKPGDKNSQLVPLTVLKLQQTQNCDELKNYIVTSIVKRNTTIPRNSYYHCSAPPGGGVPAPVPVPPPPPSAGSGADNMAGDGAAKVPDGVSDTNNQEPGVNEGDIVKADDNGIVYIVSGRHFIIAQGFPPDQLTTLKEVDLGARGLNLFLDKANQRAIVVARNDKPMYITDPVQLSQDALIYPLPQSDTTLAIFFDVSTPSEPKVLEHLQLRGFFQEGRSIDNRLHLVTNFYYYPDTLYSDSTFWTLRDAFWQAVSLAQCNNPGADPDVIAALPEVAAAKEKLTAKINDVFATLSPADYLPTASRIDPVTGDKQAIDYLACADVNHPNVDSNLGLEVITSVDTDGANLAATAVVNNAWQVYVSKDNLYLAETSWNWWWQNESGVLPTSQTAIYKFAISQDKPQYVATGRVEGYTNNQFSFSEHNGYLRVATTQDDWFFNKIDDQNVVPERVRKNNVFVLEDKGEGNLAVVGEVKGFGADENIRSSRFLGDKGFVVTFRAIDPLFTFDLGDPANPQLKGQLDIPGFSTYMHPLDDNHLITIGRGANATGVGTGPGFQLQMFDVSDLTNPVLKHKYTPSVPGTWSWSSAEYDHKAFTFYAPAGILAIPMEISPRDTTDYFSGVAAYSVSLETGFKELGRVDHSDLAYDYYCNANPTYPLLPGYGADCANGYYIFWAAPRRSVVMTSGDKVYLYTVSDIGMKASDVADLSVTLGKILFPPQPYPWWYVYGSFVEPTPLLPTDGPGLAIAN